MATLYVMIGIPGSGKSTYAKKLSKEIGCNVYSSDEIRKELCGDQQNLKNDKEVWKLLKSRMREDLLNGKDCIVDATNISKKKRFAYFEYIKDVPCEKVAVLVDTPFEECLKRNKERPKEQFVPYPAICNLRKAYQEPTLDEGFNKIIKV